MYIHRYIQRIVIKYYQIYAENDERRSLDEGWTGKDFIDNPRISERSI